ncbi:hypothetical protein [Sessilibacter corallicola]|uniref:hypothetical protein n=1 Tax=Sessilibacter corallicola TaxID=2904075 RepID=UPI001E32862A|nr:hypothetical protein [Sessilibacter corallicola]MCE2028311.1 hypothetical protein [Sessilibacter corallicola]
MGMNKKEFLESPKAIECFIAQSDFRIPSNKKDIPAWLDIGDVLSINTDSKTCEINSVSIERPDDTDLEPLEFAFKPSSKSEVEQISDHLLFLGRSGLFNKNFPEQSYRLEVIVQCDCGHGPSSNKKKLSYFFYKENEEGKTCIHASQHGGGSGSGGGWAK